MAFGKRDKTGQLQYTSLGKELAIDILDDEQFWNIVEHQNKVVFQSLNRLIFFDPATKEIFFISTKNTLLKSFKLEQQLYYQVQGEGLFQVIEDQGVLISSDAIFKDQSLVKLFKKDKGLLVATQENCLNHWQNKTLTPLQEVNQFLVGEYTLYTLN